MRLSPLLRVVAMLVYGFIGWELGVALAGVRELTSASALYILPATTIGLLLGYFLAPGLVIAPARAVRDSLRQVPIEDLFAGAIGLSMGLVIAALLAYPVSKIPPPFGTYLPFIAALFFGYIGVVVMTMRKNELLSLFGLQDTAKNIANRTANAETAHIDNNGTATKSPTANAMGEHKLLLDTSVIIDARIADVAETGFILGKMLVPRFVLNELQHIADSSEVMRRNRGRRGLEMLDSLQQNPEVDIDFIDADPDDAQEVDDKLVSLAKEINAIVVTNDYNLNRVASLQGVKILNINELANAVKTVFLPGEEIPLKIIQKGKESGQGVGYLEDGTMVVVENGSKYVEQEILVQVTKILQTNAGRLIFASPDATA